MFCFVSIPYICTELQFMFYLGSIAGILPYLLAFSLTIVLGSHAGLPFIKSNLSSASQNEIAKEEIVNIKKIESYTIDNQLIVKEKPESPVCYPILVKIESFYPTSFLKGFEAGISLLRAPPVQFI